MTDLRDLVDPLLSDPPHAAPPLDELQARVDRRRQRRSRAIGAASVFAVVLVAAAVLALPRDRELQVGGGTSAPTTQAPPPIEAAPIQLVVTPESAPATTERTIEIRNTSGDDYTTCGTYDLFSWDGETWSPVIRVYLGGGGTMFGTYDPSTTTTECSWSPISIPAGQATNLGFDPDTSVQWAVSATALPGTGPLADGWYELREPPGVASGTRPLGRFEITPPGSDPAATDPPPIEPAPIQLVVSPESAPVDAERTLEIRNTSDLPYDECGFAYGLHRWNGTSWVPVALVGASGDRIDRSDDPETPRIIDCAAADPVPAGGSRTFPFHPNAARWDPHDGTTPPRTDALGPGRYELRPHRGAQSDLRAVGRFEITGEPVSAPSSIDQDATPTTITGDEAPVTVDLYPLDLEPAGEVLPTAMYAVDQDTIAVSWNGPCNRPADHATFAARDGEIELRLSAGQHAAIDCLGEPDGWMVTFDVPFTITDRVRLVARARGVEGETNLQPAITIGSMPGSARLPDASAVSFRVVESPDPTGSGNRFVDVLPPMPLVEGFACDLSAVETNGLFILQLEVQERSAAGDSPSCQSGSLGFPLSPGVTILGQP